jgi:hypothetical protein
MEVTGSYEENGQLWKKRGVSETNGSNKEKCDSRNLSLWDVYCASLRFNWLGVGGLIIAEKCSPISLVSLAPIYVSNRNRLLPIYTLYLTTVAPTTTKVDYHGGGGGAQKKKSYREYKKEGN